MRSDHEASPARRSRKTASPLEGVIVVTLLLCFLVICYATYLIATQSLVVGIQMLGGAVVVLLLCYLFTAHTRAMRRRKY